MSLGIPPLKVNIMLESNPLKSRILVLVRGLGVHLMDNLTAYIAARMAVKRDRLAGDRRRTPLRTAEGLVSPLRIGADFGFPSGTFR